MIDDKIIKAAEYWYGKNKNNTNQNGQFKQWYGVNPEHRKAYEQVYVIKEAGVEIPTSIGEPANDDVRIFTKKTVSFIAASAAVLLIMFNISLQSDTEFVQYSSNRGEIKMVSLEDGSEVTLAPASSITVGAFTNNARNIIINDGEAFFDVAHDADRPFKVSADKTIITVLGTTFNINKRGNKYFTVSLLEGKVEIEQKINEGFISAFDEFDLVTLEPSQKVTIKKGVLLAPDQQNIEQMASWREGKLSYFNVPLELVIADINRYSSIPYVIEDLSILEIPVTAIFGTEQVEGMVKGLSQTLPISVKYNEDGFYSIISSKKNRI